MEDMMLKWCNPTGNISPVCTTGTFQKPGKFSGTFPSFHTKEPGTITVQELYLNHFVIPTPKQMLFDLFLELLGGVHKTEYCGWVGHDSPGWQPLFSLYSLFLEKKKYIYNEKRLKNNNCNN